MVLPRSKTSHSSSKNIKNAWIVAVTVFGLLVCGRFVYVAYVMEPTTLSTMTLSDPPPRGSMVFCGTCNNDDTNTQSYSPTQQRTYLEQYGWNCQHAFAPKSSTNLLLARHNELASSGSGYGTELFKYCALFLGTHSVYWDTLSSAALVDTDEILLDGTNLAIALSDQDDFVLHQPPLHHAFLKMEPKSKVALGMMRFLLETDHLTPTLLHETLALFVANDIHKKRSSWSFFTAHCRDAVEFVAENIHFRKDTKLFDSGRPCAASRGEPCCQVFASKTEQDQQQQLPIMTITHKNLVADSSSVPSSNPLPFALTGRDVHSVSEQEIGMPVDGLSYVATVREYRTNAPPATITETPNYFDILLRNNCLPHDKECFKCLKLGYKEGDEGGDCRVCEEKCPCYCKALCQVRPPPKRLAAEWVVTLPRYSADPSRLVPRIIHQTWFEPVTKDKYPNMSRLIESFRQSGWEYEFYDDDKAAQFLSAHFPPQVRQAYDAIIPGAFKADLFRYCILLIRGGVYADMDILLETNLDEAIHPSIGFLVPQDSPGETIGARSCLWNGLMAVAPGHPFMTQTIQNVVNNVRNRFTSVDYDDMLCPNPVLSVSHTVDTLFTCGPCILGASLNDVLKRHRQTGFVYGDIDLFETEKKTQLEGKRTAIVVDPDDPRLLIPGRSVLLKQNKEDMGSHRFTHEQENLIIAATDMPEYDDRPKSIEHYSKSHVKFGVYGLTKLYKDSKRANEEIVIRLATKE